jgi:hypothetical protein
MNAVIHRDYPIPNTWRWGIVRHVTEGYGPDYTPSAQGCQDKPAGIGKGASVPVTPACWPFIQKLHIGNDKGLRYVRGIGLLWINTAYNQDDPTVTAHAEQVWGGGNFVLFDTLTTTHGRAVCFDWSLDFGIFDPARVNWKNYPWLFSKCAAINVSTGDVNNVGDGIDAYFPNMRGYDSGNKITPDKWINLQEAELFPVLPFVLSDGRVVTDYLPQGASVLGKVSGNWIYLLRSTKPGERVFPTNWKIQTFGVIPPAVV